jgi:DNA polymerase (family X)
MTLRDGASVARDPTEYGNRLRLAGANPHRSKAYLRAAENLLALPVPLADVVKDDRLQDIPGVGPAIAGMIKRLCETGSHPSLEKLRREAPSGVLELLRIPGLKPEKISKLHHDLGISSIDQLEAAAKAGKIAKAKGLGSALEKKILKGIAIQGSSQGLRHINRAAELVEDVASRLRRARSDLLEVIPCGSSDAAAS